MHLKENRIAFSFIKQAYCTFEKCIRMSNFSGFLHAANGKAARKTANLSKRKLFHRKKRKALYTHLYFSVISRQMPKLHSLLFEFTTEISQKMFALSDINFRASP